MTQYRAFTEKEAVDYARELQLFEANADLASEEIGDGNLNLVFRIQDRSSGRSVIFKQALPYARVVGESWPLTLDRARIESEALKIEESLCPGLVPHIYHFDKDLALTVMEDLSDHVIMRKGLIERNRYPLFPEHIGTFLARTLFYTSDLAMNPKEKKERVGQFINPELCKITEDLIFTDPYYDAATNDINPDIRDEAMMLWNDDALKLEVALLKEKFLTQTQALLHGDLHTGSIFITETSTKVIDPEFAYYGPMGFDIGAVLANLILNYAAQEGLSPTAEERASYRSYLIDTVEQVWVQFEKEFRRLWDSDANDWTAKNTTGYQDDYVQRILRDTVGYTGCKMIRRIVGLAHVADIKSISDATKLATAEKLALSIGQALVLRHRQISSISDLVTIVKGGSHV